jgi:cytochrome c553
MPRLARSSVLALPALAFGLVTNLAPTLRQVVEAAAQAQSIPLDPGRAALMKAHYHEVLTMQDAVIRGDLSAVAPSAKAVAGQEPPSGLPPVATSYVNALREAATRAAGTTTLAAASQETASLLATCGQCHVAVGTRPAPPMPPSTTVGGVVGHMLDHQRAVDRMLQGLVVPSATLWREGAEALRVAPLHRGDLPRSSKMTGAVTAAEKRVHELADAAIALSEPSARAGSYARILTTCADCHRLHGKVWGPSRR